MWECQFRKPWPEEYIPELIEERPQHSKKQQRLDNYHHAHASRQEELGIMGSSEVASWRLHECSEISGGRQRILTLPP